MNRHGLALLGRRSADSVPGGSHLSIRLRPETAMGVFTFNRELNTGEDVGRVVDGRINRQKVGSQRYQMQWPIVLKPHSWFYRRLSLHQRSNVQWDHDRSTSFCRGWSTRALAGCILYGCHPRSSRPAFRTEDPRATVPKASLKIGCRVERSHQLRVFRKRPARK